ncbi:MAG: glucosamine-6-phosphate isomerase [Clostridiales bacterium]|nr:glucosamine-6-phosphate isomerase [Clostridiales bacterium]
MNNIYFCKPDELMKNSRLPLRVMESEADMYEEMAEIMASVIEKNDGAQTVIICPVGPIGQYPILANKINERRISLKNCIFINMDEYLTDSDETIAYDSSLSFHAIMDRQLYSRIDPELIMPESQRIFPEPGHEAEIDALIDSFEKIDCCLTGVGINGHIAFNEPPEPDDDITDEEFEQIDTRCLDISRETITNNGAHKILGALDIFPRRCISLGMRQLLKARVLKVYLYCDWQWGIMRKGALSAPTKTAPVTFLQNHSGSEMVVTRKLFEFML